MGHRSARPQPPRPLHGEGPSPEPSLGQQAQTWSMVTGSDGVGSEVPGTGSPPCGSQSLL